MCGIVGLYHFDRTHNVDKKILIQMREIMIHRGPDGCGLHLDNNFGFAHRRLSIIDLDGGKQPLCNEDGSIWVSFNGEIYNYIELRNLLLKKGHKFKTKTDTECLVHLYEEFGIDFVKRINGMFAFAIWDSKQRKLIIVRDRLGIKPLYYYLNGHSFIFASEIKSILKYDKVVPKVDRVGVKEYLIFRYLSGENSLFKDIKKLLPGNILTVEDGGNVSSRCYWDINSEWNEKGQTDSDVINEIDYLLKQSVKYRLIADVPVGAYLSGGVDSSVVTAIAANMVGKNVETFCVGFDLPDWDERTFSKKTAARYRTKHHELIIRENDFRDYLKLLNWHFDEPISHPNSVPLYHLSKYARNYVKVVLTGEGADELFGGYPRHYLVLMYSYLNKYKDKTAYILSKFLKNFPQRKIQKIAKAFESDKNSLVLFNSAFNYVEDIEKLLVPESTTNNDSYLYYRQQCFNSFNEKEDITEALLKLEIKTYLVSALERLDKMSMATGLEARVPILDHNLVEYVVGLPQRYKMRNFTNKYIFKKYSKRYLDNEVVYRSKSGFGVPLADWFRNLDCLGYFVTDLIKTNSPISEICERIALKKIVKEHMENRKDYSELLWVLGKS